MPIVFSKSETLISHFEATAHVGEIISIDGTDGSGKTYLAERLAKALGAAHVEIDNFLDRNRGGYVQFIRYEDLARCLDEHLRAGRSVVVDGVCMECVWARLRRTPTRRVYVKRMGLPGPYWKDAVDYADAERTVEEVIETWAQSAQKSNEMWATADAPKVVVEPLHIEILRYHYDQRPHEGAEVIYERVEN